ncbi:MAG: GNAT family N-acetyltransferase [Kofleriaceae bacterium]
MIRRADAADHPWIVASGAEAYHDLGDYTRILPSWLDPPGVLARIEHDHHKGTPLREARLLPRGAGLDARRPQSQPGRRGSARARRAADVSAQGIGSKLLLHVIDVAERVAPTSHIATLRLTVAETNTSAQRLYARNGFRIADGASTYDRGQRALRMVRPLDPTQRAAR